MRRYARNHARHRWMRINRLLGLAVLIALAVASIIPGVASAATPQLKSTAVTDGRHLASLASGVLIDAYGKPTQGSGKVWLNELGASKTLRAVSAFRTTSNGAFSVSYPTVSSYIKKAAARNDGYVNFMLAGGNSNAKVDFAFSARLVNGAWDGSGIKSARLVANAPLDAQEKQAASAFSRRLASSSPDAPQNIYLGVCGYNLLKSKNADTMVMEPHTSHDTVLTASYGQDNTADSDISVGISVGGAFDASGSVHIGNSQDNSSTRTVGSDYGLGLQTRFEYGKYEIDGLSNWRPECWSAPDKIKLATRWLSGLSTGWDLSYLDHTCRNNSDSSRASWGPGDQTSRDHNDLVTFAGAAHVLNFGFDSQSGASVHVAYHWYFGDHYNKYWLCAGDNNETVSQAHRVKAGW